MQVSPTRPRLHNATTQEEACGTQPPFGRFIFPHEFNDAIFPNAGNVK
jgi:hypothetical protein